MNEKAVVTDMVWYALVEMLPYVDVFGSMVVCGTLVCRAVIGSVTLALSSRRLLPLFLVVVSRKFRLTLSLENVVLSLFSVLHHNRLYIHLLPPVLHQLQLLLLRSLKDGLTAGAVHVPASHGNKTDNANEYVWFRCSKND
eukprot:GHVS01078006.1.p1 GENE.GHVS01078006.1~~GHVS01078006.1.p1  ORF type:complete len:141 (+),score=11.27 GHVS01078006.1:141-563(+)